jgi:ERCC4-related helicase
MRHLKLYENFESSYDDIKETIKDILLPISDMGYDIRVSEIPSAIDALKYHQNRGTYNVLPKDELSIRVVNYTDNPLFISSDVLSEFNRLKDYLETEGFNQVIVYYVRLNSTTQHASYYEEFIDKLESDYFRNLLFIAKKL